MARNFDKPVILQGDGIVDGTAGKDQIDLAYAGDPHGDMIDANDAILPGEAPNDDIVDAGAGDDVIKAGLGDDEVYAGSGSDTVYGGSGNDVIYGDSNYPGGSSGGTVRESFEWDLAPDPDGSGDIDSGDDLSGGFTQNTGSVDVTFSVVNESAGVDTTFNVVDQVISDINSDGGSVDENSSLRSLLNGESNCAEYRLDFSASVTDISFRINDIDHDSVVQVQAFDAEGQLISVNITGGSYTTVTDEDSAAGDDTATSNGDSTTPIQKVIQYW
jgi:Ca2+-binding RTX toxin-like protein